MGFFSRLEKRCREVNSLLCVGLDPHPADLAENTLEGLRRFCMRIVEETADQAAAFKPNIAFFEAFGAPGLAVLQEIIASIPPSIPVILDAKRGDIASTAEAYARAVFETLGASAVTASPYLGHDSLEPLLADLDHGVFLLCKTSNPGSQDLQDLRVSGSTVYETVARLASRWNTRDNLGLVVGATHADALQRVRALAPELWILAPGVGAQGGDLAAALNAGLRADGLGLLVPVSRQISRAADPHQAASELREAINRQRQSITLIPRVDVLHNSLAMGLLEAECVRFGTFTLKSGLQSPIYIDLRRLVGFPRLLEQVAEAYLLLLKGLEFQRLAALPYAGLPIATAVSLMGGIPMVYPRKEVKTYGTRAEVEGVFTPGEQVVVIDDLATTGDSKFEAIEKLQSADLKVRDVVVLIDRQSGAAESLEKQGYRLHAVFSLTQLLDIWALSGIVPEEKVASARAFIGKGAN